MGLASLLESSVIHLTKDSHTSRLQDVFFEHPSVYEGLGGN